ncbi:MAG: sigma-70 family RNA polymerase sigma factor [candidate division Zixibacteria bacterium]|nr:sigma-70 family RNA polymerase sigma factor [candidate division Zixibacteria bacterium]
MSNADERQIIKNAVNGDRRAFNEIVNRYKQRIYFTVMKMVRNKDDAYDITQDTFIKAYKNLDRFRGDSNFYTWLCRIAINTAINFKSRDKYREMASVADINTVPESIDRPDHNFAENQLFDRLDKAVAGLPAQQKKVFALRYYDQMPHAEIAQVLNLSEGAVKANYFQAIKKLKNEFSDIIYKSESKSAGKEVEK